MYYKGQTLRHKVNDTLVRTYQGNIDDSSVLHWGNLPKGEIFFVSENGTLFNAKRDDYTHIEDELGRPCIGHLKEGEHVATHLRKYVVSPRRMAALREKKLLEWEATVLGEMEERQEVRNPFADGSVSWVFMKWFLKRRGALPLHKSYDRIAAEFHDDGFPESRDSLFFYQGKFWVYLGHLGRLAVTEVSQLEKVAALVQSHGEGT